MLIVITIYEYCQIWTVRCISIKFTVRIITGMDRNAPEWASITEMDIKIN